MKSRYIHCITVNIRPLLRTYCSLTFQKLWLEGQFKELHKKIDVLMASGIAKALQPLLTRPTSSTLPPAVDMNTPVTTSMIPSSTSSTLPPAVDMNTPMITSMIPSSTSSTLPPAVHMNTPATTSMIPSSTSSTLSPAFEMSTQATSLFTSGLCW